MDYVLLLGCVSGNNGFPSSYIDESAFEIAKQSRSIDDAKIEEERRLFYVAITRCKKHLFLFLLRRHGP